MTENYLNILAETIRNNRDQPALTDFYLTEDGTAQDTSRGNHYTYGEMYAEFCRVANLLTSLGLQKGDHIAICGANSAHWVIAYLAIAKMQGVSVTVMRTLMPDEIAHMVNFSDAKALFVDEDLWKELSPLHRPILGALSSVISLDNWSILKGEDIKISNDQCQMSNREVGFSPVEPDSLAMICFTSGTSGKAKGVMSPIRGISNNINATLSFFPHDKNPNYIAFLPFAHMSGIMGELLPQLVIHRHIYICKEIYSLEGFKDAIEICKPYLIISVPKLYAGLLNKYGDYVLELFQRTCKLLCIGGALLDEKTEKHLDHAHIPIGIVYGLTETTAEISLSPYGGHRMKSVGKIVSGMTCRISPVGEILVKGENVMLGYYKDPEATAAKIDSDGWLHTGDKGHLDEDGYLYVEGRLEQDIIVLPNGENIRPDNIESLINALPEVSESIVLARDGKLVAIVVPSSPLALGEGQGVRLLVLRAVNPQLPIFSQLYDVEISDTPLQRTEKQTIKRYLYK